MGYDVEDFVKQPDKNFICSICSDVLRNPRSCASGHFFCLECITTWQRTKPTCPEGRCKLTLTRAIPLEGLIDALDVRCSNRAAPQSKPKKKKAKTAASAGCEWTGPLRDLTKHKNMCQFEVISCQWDGCDEEGVRSFIEGEHEAECPRRVVECDLCGEDIAHEDVEDHKDEDCPKAPVACKYACTEGAGRNKTVCEFSREDLDDHYEECPKAPVQCPLSSIGCSQKLVRGELQAHAHTAALNHVALLATELAEAKRRLGEVKEQLNQEADYVWNVSGWRGLTGERGAQVESGVFRSKSLDFTVTLHLSGRGANRMVMGTLKLCTVQMGQIDVMVTATLKALDSDVKISVEKQWVSFPVAFQLLPTKLLWGFAALPDRFATAEVRVRIDAVRVFSDAAQSVRRF